MGMTGRRSSDEGILLLIVYTWTLVSVTKARVKGREGDGMASNVTRPVM